MSSTIALKLTRAVEADPRFKAIESTLQKDCRNLWEGSPLSTPHIPLSPALVSCLRNLMIRNQLERGLERIEQLLGNEQKGLLSRHQKEGTTPAHRVSRLFIVSNDGSERFYRACERTLQLHSDRVLLLCVDASSEALTESLMGKTDKILKALLVSDRDAVSKVLFSLTGETTQD